MQPAVYEVDINLVPDVEAVLAAVNTATAGPTVTATVEGNRVVFVCETWRPILQSRVDDALDAGGAPAA